MGLKKVTPDLAYQLDAAMRGDVTKIPNPLGERLAKIFNLLPSRYTLVGGSIRCSKERNSLGG